MLILKRSKVYVKVMTNMIPYIYVQTEEMKYKDRGKREMTGVETKTQRLEQQGEPVYHRAPMPWWFGGAGTGVSNKAR